MTTLNDQIAKLLTEVKKDKGKKKTSKKKTEAKTTSGLPSSLISPWQDEALVIIATTHTCRSCGNETTSWSPYIYIERSRVVRKTIHSTIERLPHCDPDIAYESLPRRIEHREETTCRCHLCFGNLPNGFKHDSVQLTLPLHLPVPGENNAQ